MFNRLLLLAFFVLIVVGTSHILMADTYNGADSISIRSSAADRPIPTPTAPSPTAPMSTGQIPRSERPTTQQAPGMMSTTGSSGTTGSMAPVGTVGR